MSSAGGPVGRPRSQELGAEACEAYLASCHVARVAWHSPDGLQLLPVSYAWHERSLVFRTSAYGRLSDLVRPTQVVVEVDELNADLSGGWSVVVHGTATGVADAADLVRLWTVAGLTPWAEGLRTAFIRVRPSGITGRRFER